MKNSNRKQALKNVGMAALTGLIAGAGTEFVASNVRFIGANWWGAPGLQLGAAVLLANRGGALGAAARDLAAIAGYSGYQQFRVAGAMKAASAPAETAGLLNRGVPARAQIPQGTTVPASSSLRAVAAG